MGNCLWSPQWAGREWGKPLQCRVAAHCQWVGVPAPPGSIQSVKTKVNGRLTFGKTGDTKPRFECCTVSIGRVQKNSGRKRQA